MIITKGQQVPPNNVRHILVFSSRGDFKQVHSVLDYCPSCRTDFRPLVMRSCYPSMMDSTAHKNRGSSNYKNVLRKINLLAYSLAFTGRVTQICAQQAVTMWTTKHMCREVQPHPGKRLSVVTPLPRSRELALGHARSTNGCQQSQFSKQPKI